MPNADQVNSPSAERRPLMVGDWLWRPVYARLWWAAVPLYWGGMAASGRVQALGAFYDSAAAGFLTIFFFPPLVALILCFGFFREWLAALPLSEGATLSPGDCFPDPDSYGPSGMPWEFDPLDPRSGALWNGSPLNPINPGYINRAS